MMTFEEAKKVFLNRGWFPVENGNIFDANKWRESVQVISSWLAQEPCENVPETNVGDIYECSCGYGWNKSKVVRHHFCPNCGRAVDNSIRTELEPCEDVINRQAVLEAIEDDNRNEHYSCFATNNDAECFKQIICDLPSVTPQPKEMT